MKLFISKDKTVAAHAESAEQAAALIGIGASELDKVNDPVALVLAVPELAADKDNQD